jgi:hypothetical protein
MMTTISSMSEKPRALPALDEACLAKLAKLEERTRADMKSTTKPG